MTINSKDAFLLKSLSTFDHYHYSILSHCVFDRRIRAFYLILYTCCTFVPSNHAMAFFIRCVNAFFFCRSKFVTIHRDIYAARAMYIHLHTAWKYTCVSCWSHSILECFCVRAKAAQYAQQHFSLHSWVQCWVGRAYGICTCVRSFGCFVRSVGRLFVHSYAWMFEPYMYSSCCHF